MPPPPPSSPTAIDLLRRWISGDLRRTDERSLETAAREDELVGDALRGYRSRPEDDHAAALGRLRAGLPARKRAARRLPLRLAAAAALLLLLTAATLYFTTDLLHKSASSLADAQAEAPALPPEPSTTPHPRRPLRVMKPKPPQPIPRRLPASKWWKRPTSLPIRPAPPNNRPPLPLHRPLTGSSPHLRRRERPRPGPRSQGPCPPSPPHRYPLRTWVRRRPVRIRQSRYAAPVPRQQIITSTVYVSVLPIGRPRNSRMWRHPWLPVPAPRPLFARQPCRPLHRGAGNR